MRTTLARLAVVLAVAACARADAGDEARQSAEDDGSHGEGEPSPLSASISGALPAETHTADAPAAENSVYDPRAPDSTTVDGAWGDRPPEVAAANARPRLLARWDEHLAKFSPDMYVTFLLPAGREELFYADVADAPELLQGGFAAEASEGPAEVNFSIKDPDGNEFLKQDNATEALFQFEAQSAGTYTIQITNRGRATDGAVTVSFAVSQGRPSVFLIEGRDIYEALANSTRTSERLLEEAQAGAAFNWVRLTRQIEWIGTIDGRFVWLGITRMLLIPAWACFEAFYVKSFFADEAEYHKNK